MHGMLLEHMDAMAQQFQGQGCPRATHHGRAHHHAGHVDLAERQGRNRRVARDAIAPGAIPGLVAAARQDADQFEIAG
jgi:hypothetical protein